ncbi:hypothetical protein KZX47_04745 [Thermus sp. SYSU G05001]|uniref:Uncharacterized protein n=1 Tax=Thermus brevis TaxID=2862456 RepID=A0ABS6ZWM2_9DEIN|nr:MULTISPECIES: hypothetical protein [Thermus]MBW6394464.1 hypothetical protein [Thermus brevis]
MDAQEPQSVLGVLNEHPGEHLRRAHACLGLAYRSQALLALGREEATYQALTEALAQVAVAALRLGEAA